MSSKPIHASSHGQDGLIHHLAWAAVAVTWLVVIDDPITMVTSQEANPPQSNLSARTYQPSQQPAPGTSGNFAGFGVRPASFHGDPWRAADTAVKRQEPHDDRCLTLEGTIEYVSGAQQIPLTEAEMRDLAALLKSL